MMNEQLSTRPWTVKALVVLGILGAISYQIRGAMFDVFDVKDSLSIVKSVLGIGVAILFAWGLWNGKRWAYVLTVIGAGLSSVILTVYVFGNLGSIGAVGKLIWFIDVAATWYLVLHPQTRTFFDKPNQVRPLPEDALRRP